MQYKRIYWIGWVAWPSLLGHGERIKSLKALYMLKKT